MRNHLYSTAPSFLYRKSVVVGAIILASTLILLSGILYVLHEKRVMQDRISAELTMLGQVQSDRLAYWHEDEIRDATLIADNGVLSNFIHRIQIPGNANDSALLTRYLTSLKLEHGYSDLFLLTEGSNTVFPSRAYDDIDVTVHHYADSAFRRGGTVSTDIYSCEIHQTAHLDFISVIPRNSLDRNMALVCRFDPAEALSLMIENRPIAHSTAITFIARREGDSVLVLQTLPGRKANASFARYSLHDSTSVAVRAANGERGIMAATDARGEDVIAFVNAVPRTEWFLVSEINATEAYDDPLYTLFGMVLIINLLLISTLIIGVLYVYRSRQRDVYRYMSERQEEFHATLDNITAAIITTDREGSIRFINRAGLRLLDVDEDTASGIRLDSVVPLLHEATGKRLDDIIGGMRNNEASLLVLDAMTLVTVKSGTIPVTVHVSKLMASDNEVSGYVLVLHDQSEQRARQQAMEESERKYRSLFQATTEAIVLCQVVWSDDRQIIDALLIDCNERAVELFEIDKRRQTGLSGRDIRNMNIENLFDHCRAVLDTAEPTILDMQIENTDRYFTLAITTPGEHRIAFIFQDITKHRKMEEELRESESLYRAMFEDHAAIKMLIDPETGALIDANHAAARFYGWKREDLRNMHIRQISTLPESQIAAQLRDTAELRQTQLQSRHRRADGSIRDVEILSGPIRIKGKTLLHSVIYDITENLQAQQRMRLLAKAVEESPNIIIITDADGRIEYVNKHFSMVSGYRSEEVIGSNARILKSGTHPPEFYRELWGTLRAGEDWIGEFHNIRKDGAQYWVRATISPVFSEDRSITHFIALNTDITDQKRLMEELISAKEHAEQSDHLKSAFLANMSHEVRTPMNAIIGFSELLMGQESTTEELRQYTEIIQQRSYDLLNIINDILHVSLLDSGELTLLIEAGSIGAMLKDLHLTFEHLNMQRNATNVELKLINELAPGEDSVLFDFGRVRQVLSNLLSNSLKFTKSGNITFGCRRDGEDTLLFFVSDTGIGIPDKAREFIFNRFRQVDDSSSRSHGGTGLGLSISKGLVELMDGRIWVESEAGRGSSFYFTLPYRPTDSSKHETGNN
ncbi:MAG: PAS domain S-box protein [Bacteroidetes bacterium]|nr:PAS domain S-box protein [Bacteroidota bacterium]